MSRELGKFNGSTGRLGEVRDIFNGVKGSYNEERCSGPLVSILMYSDPFSIPVISFPGFVLSKVHTSNLPSEDFSGY